MSTPLPEEASPLDRSHQSLEEASGSECRADDRIVHKTTFATIYKEKVSMPYIGHRSQIEERFKVIDENGFQTLLPDELGVQEFIELDTGVEEYVNYRSGRFVTNELVQKLPSSHIAEAVATSITAQMRRQLDLIKIERSAGMTDDRYRTLLLGQRDVYFAIAGACQALNLYQEGLAHVAQDPFDTHAWYQSGEKGRAGMYTSRYSVCTDDFHGDPVDHYDELKTADDDDLWPDEFHYPGTRIEFLYKPDITTMRQRHESHSVHGDTITHNDALSIRIDRDPDAPNGLSVDIGRSVYDAVYNGKRLYRTNDLLGGILMDASPSACHAYDGFIDTDLEEFESFTQRLVVQLELQCREHVALAKRISALANKALIVARR